MKFTKTIQCIGLNHCTGHVIASFRHDIEIYWDKALLWDWQLNSNSNALLDSKFIQQSRPLSRTRLLYSFFVQQLYIAVCFKKEYTYRNSGNVFGNDTQLLNTISKSIETKSCYDIDNWTNSNALLDSKFIQQSRPLSRTRLLYSFFVQQLYIVLDNWILINERITLEYSQITMAADWKLLMSLKFVWDL